MERHGIVNLIGELAVKPHFNLCSAAGYTGNRFILIKATCQFAAQYHVFKRLSREALLQLVMLQ